MNAEVLGQPQLVERMVIGLLADGHLLIEDLPDAPKPGDALTLTFTTTAVRLRAMLLPPLANRIPTPGAWAPIRRSRS